MARSVQNADSFGGGANSSLTTPLLVGPGTIATLIVFGQTAFTTGKEVSLAGGMIAFLIILSAALLAAPSIGHYLSPKVTAITKRLMGMILAAIAVQTMVSSLQNFFRSGTGAGH